MGWWNITDDRAGLFFLHGEPDEDTQMYMGDGPADIMGPAIDEVAKLYQETWGRKPYLREVIAAAEFSSGHLELEETATPGYIEKKHKELWAMARKYVLEHAGNRIRNHTEVGGSDLEIVDNTIDEVFDLCVKLAMGKLPVNELPAKLELEGDDGKTV
jgi:hypothetical protein